MRGAIRETRINNISIFFMKYTHLNAKAIPLDDGIDLPAEKLPEPIWINVKGREEHESLLRDSKKMHSLGLDPYFEKITYLKRWGSWLNGSESLSGN